MEAYQRHAEERRMEKQILAEEGERGKQTNSHLTRTAEVLSVTLSDLLEKKKRADEERQRCQAAIENLKKCLRVLR
jgi:hypothetical protein